MIYFIFVATCCCGCHCYLNMFEETAAMLKFAKIIIMNNHICVFCLFVFIFIWFFRSQHIVCWLVQSERAVWRGASEACGKKYFQCQLLYSWTWRIHIVGYVGWKSRARITIRRGSAYWQINLFALQEKKLLINQIHISSFNFTQNQTNRTNQSEKKVAEKIN